MSCRIRIFLFISVVLLNGNLNAIAQPPDSSIAFVSDTQAPLLVESIIRKTNHNKLATKLIFDDVVAKHPSHLFILGDVVSLGYPKNKWKTMDGYLAACKRNNIIVTAALGNHELMFHARKGAARFQAHFPLHSFTGYITIADSMAIILLNSNFNKMTTIEIKQQDDWYAAQLLQLNTNPAIRFVIVGCHHSPFTNSKVVQPSIWVQQKFLPRFLSTKKCILFMSGHSHNFEQFKFQGKDFLVIGGGGGIHQPLRTSENVVFDLAANYKPMFHYVTINRFNNVLQITSHQLKNNFSGFEEGLRFNIESN